ncbi:MAG: DNA-processing protein DprA [Alphaproteobacteria bacterium]|nr:DNA-processing protein DprA [Alphaproteobacteria bacterium]
MQRRTRALTSADRLDWLRLIRSENVGPITFHELLRRFGSAAAALEALPELARRGGRRAGIRIATRAEAERELAALAGLGARVIGVCEPDYPPLLAQIDDAPPLLYAQGHPRLAARPVVAMVGARNASAAGVRLAREMAARLGAAGIAVASGLARGIDTAAHRGALASGTIAAVAGGIDVIYPPENRDLQQAIAEQGLLLAELPPGTEPLARHFPRRNRLVSGMARAVVVVEAALKSGSLITARLAAEQGREVMAVPGSPLDPRARGGNDLIRTGAALVESAEDVLALLAGLPDLAEPPGRDPVPPPQPPGEAELADGRARLLSALSPVPIEIDELARQCALAPGVLQTVLIELELAGRLERQPGGRVAIRTEEPPRI